MKAYVTEITLVDDDGILIGKLTHDCDDLFIFTPKEGSAAWANDYKFIAKVLESDLITTTVEG
jgi:hypothetical protein